MCENDLPSGYSTSPETLTVSKETSKVCTTVEETGLRHAAGNVRRKHESLLAQNNTRPGFSEWQRVSVAPAGSTVNETAKILPALLFTIRLVFVEPRSRRKQTETAFLSNRSYIVWSCIVSRLLSWFCVSREKKSHPSGNHRRVLFQLCKTTDYCDMTRSPKPSDKMKL